MAKFKINDIELEYDILELENAEKFEKAVLKAQSEAAAAVGYQETVYRRI